MKGLDVVYGHFKDLTRRRTSDKILSDKAFDIARNPKYDGYQRELASIIYPFSDKKLALVAGKSASSRVIKNENISNKELSGELHKPIIKNSRKEKYTYSL